MTDLSRLRVVLSRPSHPGNIGAAARAMKTMGLGDLVLVAPRFFPDADATAMAAGAADLLERARVVRTLEAALDDCTESVGFTARGRGLAHPIEALRDAAPSLLAAAGAGRVALVFGNEASGLSNDEILACRRAVAIPANAAYSSLNLASAVQVACYELATAAAAHAPPPTVAGDPATGEDVRGLVEHLEAVSVQSGYIDPANPGRFIERMRRLFARAGLEREEVRVLRGFLNACARRMRPEAPPARGTRRRPWPP